LPLALGADTSPAPVAATAVTLLMFLLGCY